MASPQDGPNLDEGFSRTAHEMQEAITCFKFSERKRAVIGFIVRLTYGFSRADCEFSHSEAASDTGIERANLSKTLRDLNDENVVICLQRPTFNAPGRYKLNSHWKTWKTPMLGREPGTWETVAKMTRRVKTTPGVESTRGVKSTRGVENNQPEGSNRHNPTGRFDPSCCLADADGDGLKSAPKERSKEKKEKDLSSDQERIENMCREVPGTSLQERVTRLFQDLGTFGTLQRDDAKTLARILASEGTDEQKMEAFRRAVADQVPSLPNRWATKNAIDGAGQYLVNIRKAAAVKPEGRQYQMRSRRASNG